MRYNLKNARIGKGLTQANVALYLWIDIGYYKAIEKGIRTGNVEIWDKLEDLFSVHQRELRKIS